MGTGVRREHDVVPGELNVAELRPDLIRRVLVALANDNNMDLLWHTMPDGSLRFCLDCSDFFDLASADCEPVETEEDVVLLERCLFDCQVAEEKSSPDYVGYLYAARRRGVTFERWAMKPDGAYYVSHEVRKLFREIEGAK